MRTVRINGVYFLVAFSDRPKTHHFGGCFFGGFPPFLFEVQIQRSSGSRRKKIGNHPEKQGMEPNKQRYTLENSGQTIATSNDLTRNGGLEREGRSYSVFLFNSRRYVQGSSRSFSRVYAFKKNTFFFGLNACFWGDFWFPCFCGVGVFGDEKL